MKEPPLVLVKTWYNLLINQQNKVASEHAQNMLLGAFGSEQAVAEYLRKHNIID